MLALHRRFCMNPSLNSPTELILKKDLNVEKLPSEVDLMGK